MLFLVTFSFDLYNAKILILGNNVSIEFVHCKIHKIRAKCAIIFCRYNFGQCSQILSDVSAGILVANGEAGISSSTLMSSQHILLSSYFPFQPFSHHSLVDVRYRSNCATKTVRNLICTDAFCFSIGTSQPAVY